MFMDNVLQQYQTACTDAVLFDLSANAKVELSGPDARQFLHNICTNDVKNLAEGTGCEAFLTTAKARIIAHVFIGHYRWHDQPVLWLDTVAGQAAALVRHLDHYIISEQVEVADRTDALSMHRAAGPGAQQALEGFFRCNLAGLKHLQHQSIRFSDGTDGFIRRFDSLSVPAFDIFGLTAPRPAPLGLALADQQVHEILRVEAGLPAFGSDMDENRLVMEVGRTAQSISYAKGCFLGQEPIVMARDRGQVNRVLLGVKVAAGDALPRGTRLFKGEEEVGQVTSSMHSPRLGQVIALA
jgi:folate-binding protein YgfZ